MEFIARRRKGDAIERCPYCRDILADTRLAEVECPGCSTAHHVVCIQELGRCTIRGCEQPMVASEPERWEDSPELRRVRKRLRERVRQFVGTHAKNPRERVVDALERARTLEREKRYKAAIDAYDDLVYLERLPEVRNDVSLDAVPGRLTVAEARSKAREMRQLQRNEFARFVGTVCVAVVGLPLALWLVLFLGMEAL